MASGLFRSQRKTLTGLPLSAATINMSVVCKLAPVFCQTSIKNLEDHIINIHLPFSCIKFIHSLLTVELFFFLYLFHHYFKN